MANSNDTRSSSEFPGWNDANPEESLSSVYQWTVKNAQDHINWYDTRKDSKRSHARGLRTGAIILAALGALCPLIAAALPDNFSIAKLGDVTIGNVTTAYLGQWGYIFIALAAALIGYDRFFGLSSGWMRYTTTLMSLEKALKEFQYDWLILHAQHLQQQLQSNTVLLLQRLKDFTDEVDNLVRQETDTWVTEFQANISEFEKTLRSESEARKPGSIKITAVDAGSYAKVTILLDDNVAKDLGSGITESLLNSIPPGPHQVTITGEKDNQQYKDSKVVEVKPDTLASVELNLQPISTS